LNSHIHSDFVCACYQGLKTIILRREYIVDIRKLKGRRKYRPSYNILSANDYSFYTVFRGDFDSYNECKQTRDELYDLYNKKVMNATKRERSNILTFE